jgi:hypothetical protein
VVRLSTQHRFRNRVLRQLAEGAYEPVLDDGLKHCLSTLPWWREGQQLKSGEQQTAVAGAHQEAAVAAAASSSSSSPRAAGAYRKHIRQRIWRSKQQRHRRNLGGPGKLVL